MNVKVIKVDGANTLNKGAELMLWSVVQQIKKRSSEIKIVYNTNVPFSDRPNIEKEVGVIKRPASKYGKIFNAILFRLGYKGTYFSNFYPQNGIDLILDAGGFQFSDQWVYSSKKLDNWKNYYKAHKEKGAKIILLPQALGPFNTDNGRAQAKIIIDYCDVIIAREEKSKKYLLNLGVDPKKVWCYPDFTCITDGIVKQEYSRFNNKVCIIPNKKMNTHHKSNGNSYEEFLLNIINILIAEGEEPFFLNHEGKGDLELCNKLNSKFGNKFEIVNGQNALETKGVIGSSKFTISSRFHGVASALSQGIPCLSTSWNHKYEMLFLEYGITDGVLNMDLPKEEISKRIKQELSLVQSSKKSLLHYKKHQSQKIEDMWGKIWQISEVSK
ncbi:hypothetical protein GCM10007049_04360 [Echinicola pacifica]|uniref:Polysaccharide pyruvyl transferase domain-containing protein n=1 Tax=Echinicola pacifica TaxID=346377 RepID=A0A918PN33_9BACT|nr:polysaccharide pyruvyl transferase family protein [Echinicola pacifica]GGZ15396.1 hypothetical protein GCM10007049_04360 [Echinicola pacifica]